jgi:ribosomal protein L29
MKRNDYIKTVRRLTVKELTDKIQEGKKRMIELDQEKLLGKLKNTALSAEQRRQIAQMLTVRDEKITEELKNA